MSIFKVLEDQISKSYADYSKYLYKFTGDLLKGSEFMFFALTNFFKDSDIQEIEDGIVDSS